MEILKNKKVLDIINNNKFIIFGLLLVYLILQVPFLTTGRPVICDEAWYTNSAYNFSQGLWVRNTNVGSGGDVNFIFPLIQGLFFWVFGYSLFLARFVSVIAGLFAIILIYFILNKLNIPKKHIYISLLAVIFIPYFHSVFRYARPESWAIVFVLLSLLYFVKYLNNCTKKNILLIGLFCALGFLTHPYTLSVSFYIGIIILIKAIKNKTLSHLLLYVSPIVFSFVIFIINAYNLIGADNLQFISERLIKNDINYLYKIRSTLTGLFSYYIFNKRIIYFLPLTFVLLLGLLYKNKNNLFFQSSLMGISVFFISLIFFSSRGFDVIMSYVFIFSIFNFSFITLIYKQKTILLIIISYLIIMLSASVFHDFNKHETINAKLETKLPIIIAENKKVFGPIVFWLFLPKTQYISSLYRNFNKEKNITALPVNYDYFIIYENDPMKESNIYKPFINSSNKKLIYTDFSKNYGKIQVYKLNNNFD